MRRLFLALALLDLAVVGWALVDELVARRPWKATQAAWNRVLAARGEQPERVGIREIMVPALELHDRCTTCHLGVTRDGLGAEVPAVFRSHPRRAELLGAHPPDRFGCTPCHDGQGPQTKGVARRPFDHGRDDPYWERPLRSGPWAESSCLDCHEEIPAGAPELLRGRRLFEALACHGCHAGTSVAPVKTTTPPAPSLARLREKMSEAFVVEWLRGPAAVRPGTRMPDPWPKPVEPDGKPSPPGSPREARWRAEMDEETGAIAAYLGAATSEEQPLPELVPRGDLSEAARVEEGRALFERAGCRGCHLLSSAEAQPAEGPAPAEEQRFGPPLDAIGEKASPRWLSAWLSGPRRVWAGARMPDPRLLPVEIDRLVAFLGAQRRAGHAADGQGAPTWRGASPEQVARGKAAIERLGCAGCHAIPGIAGGSRSGPDLDGFGDKAPDEVSFGDARIDCGTLGRLACFALEKLRAPRRLEGHGATALSMPDFRLSDGDARALAIFTLSQRERHKGTPSSHRRVLDARERALADGERVVTARNCRGCHETARRVEKRGDDEVVIREGGAVRRYYPEAALAPPLLDDAGRKFQYPWLWDFLRAPQTIRPYLSVRMPDYGLSDEEIDALARWMAAREGEPYPAQRLARVQVKESDRPTTRALFAKLQCGKCHPAPGAATAGVSSAELAPDLALAPRRLKPDWVREWLLDPQRLMPDTRMPSFFAPVDEEQPAVRMAVPGFFDGEGERQAARQIDVLVGAVMAPEGLAEPVGPGGARSGR